MSDDYSLSEVKFLNIRYRGSGYDAGVQIAESLQSSNDAVRVYTSGKENWERFGFKDFESMQNNYETYIPGIIEEIQGFADTFGVPSRKVSFWLGSYDWEGGVNCSQVGVPSNHTTCRHVLAGRSYEWNTDEDRILHHTGITGRYAHMGFTCFLFGRLDGINQYGLLVSMTGGGIFGVPMKTKAPSIWVAIRSLLESCRDVDEGLEKLREMPVGGHFNLMLLDPKDNAAIVSYADGVKTTKRRENEPYIWSVNHYELPEMEEFNEKNVGIIHHSRIRSGIIQSVLNEKVSKDDVRRLFSTLHPGGLCNHFYKDYLGTLWSIIYDLTDQSVDICFGAPTHNPYREFSLDDESGITEYNAVIPNRPWSD